MRIIAGRFKGRRLVAPKGSAVRPTSDSLRETLFNVLGDRVMGATVLDAFAGTGALGLEALSRGAAAVTFVEASRDVFRVLTANVQACGAAEACMIVSGDFLRISRAARGSSLEPHAFDLVLVDPPYDDPKVSEILASAASLVSPGGRLVFEHARRRPSPEHAGALVRSRLIEAGDSALSFYPATETS